MTRKRYKSAPLPFVGQKRLFLKHFEQILENIPDEGEGWTIVDVFGGSGLLAHTAKHLKPKARVIYNDFDGYAERLAHIKDINALRQILAKCLEGVPSQVRLTKAQKQAVIAQIEAFDSVKDLNALSAWLLFSGKQVGSFEKLCRKELWNCVRKSDYPEAEGYLEGLEVVCHAFEQLIPQFQDNPKTLLLLDPPYICTRQESYKQAHYFDLIAFLKLVDLVKPPYLFFSSTKSEFVRFVDYMQQTKQKNWQAFDGATHIKVNASVSHNGKYEDNLVYKF